MNKVSIRDLSKDIATALGGTHEDIVRLIDGGHLRVEVEQQAAFLPVLETTDGQVIVGDNQVRYRYVEYAGHLSLIREERKQGRNNLFYIVDKLRAMDTANAIGPKKAAHMTPQSIYGHETVLRPYMGTSMRIRRDMCIPFHHFAFQHVLSQYVTPEIDVVFEIGSGLGDSISELAARSPYSHIDFIGGEIALNGRKCIDEFADILKLPNLRGVDFDITRPNFDFMKGKKNALVFSQFAMCCIKPFQAEFWKQLVDSVENLTALIFEPFSFELADQMPGKPGFTLSQAKSYGVSENFFACIKEAEQQGHIVIDEVVPDIFGKTALSAVSLARFHKKTK